MSRDLLPCGCHWTREKNWEAAAGIFISGDVLHQCSAHQSAAPTPYEGSAPMNDDEMDDLLTTLRDGGFEAEEFSP